MRLFAAEFEKTLTRRTSWISTICLGLGYLLSLWLTTLTLDTFTSHLQEPSAGLAAAVSFLYANTFFCGSWAWFASAATIGGEQSTGALGTLFTFEPRRGRVLAAKLASVIVPAVVVALVTCGVAIATIGASGTLSTAGLGPLVLAVTAVVGLMALLGFTAAVVTGSTLGGLGVLISWGLLTGVTYLVIVPRLELDADRVPGLERFIWQLVIACTPEAGTSLHLSPLVPALVLVGASVLAVAGCWFVLTRRDLR